MLSVLLIEDNTDINETTSEMLEMAGYEVVAVTDSKQGVGTALQINPDIILCDISMPEKDGYEILSQLKENPLTSKIPFVFFTAHTQSREIKKGLALGASGYLCKPFTEEELLKVIERSIAVS